MPPRAKKAATEKVDETVVNQENPVTSEKQRESTEKVAEPETPKMAPAHDVDETVVNQESPGSGEFKDRNPDPQIVSDSAGIEYDVSKSQPELVDKRNSDEELERKAKLRQTESVLDAKKIEGENDEEARSEKYIEIHFVDTGLTAQGTVWKRGEVLRLVDNDSTKLGNSDTNGDVWYELSAEDQKRRFGRVMFEKR